jgi:predicted O-methyltransferase YrrM
MKRTFRHWTPRYLFDRVVEQRYRRQYPGLPWLTPEANRILETYLLPADAGLEFGSGGSTRWLAAHVGQLTSVEHNPLWFEKVQQSLKESHVQNTRYLLREKEGGDDKESPHSAYVKVAGEFPEASLDFVLIDGIYRGSCACAVLPKVKPGGMIVVDNVNHYLPCDSFSPNSRRKEQGPVNEQWTQFWEIARSWRRVWTSNGVSDTAFFFKPVNSV